MAARCSQRHAKLRTRQGREQEQEQAQALEIGPLDRNEVGPAIAIFQRAFADEQRARFLENSRPNALLDIWTFLQRTCNEGFIGARERGRLVGYALFVPSLGAVQRRAVLSGAALTWAIRGIAGRYDLAPGRLIRTLQNKVYFFAQGRRFRTRGDAQLLNVAVDPLMQGRGIARRLIDAGLQALHRLKVLEVRLEVRPSNAAAIALYRKTGWREVGRTRDLEGEWIVMVANP